MKTTARDRRTAWRSIVVGLVALSLAGVLPGCKEELTRPPPNPPPQVDATTRARTDAGWASFEAGDYSSALASFQSALQVTPNYTDARSGEGWCHFRLDNLTGAAASFDSAAVYGEYWQENEAYVNALAGQAFTASAREEYQKVVTAAALATELGGDRYRFAHDTSIGASHVRLALAEAHLQLGDYEKCFLVLAEIDITVRDRVDPQSERYVEELLEEITRISLSI